MIKLFNERKDTLKCLHLDGYDLSEESYQHLHVCQNLEELQITNCHRMNKTAISAISKLHNLKTLNLIVWGEEPIDVSEDDFISMIGELKNLLDLEFRYGFT